MELKPNTRGGGYEKLRGARKTEQLTSLLSNLNKALPQVAENGEVRHSTLVINLWYFGGNAIADRQRIRGSGRLLSNQKASGLND